VSILVNQLPDARPPVGPVSPLNAIWLGSVRRRVSLPQYGHLLLLFPLAESVVSGSGIIVDTHHYVLLTTAVTPQPLTVNAFEPPASGRSSLLVLWLSPPFIVDMAHFLNIPDNLPQLLHGIPLWRGDRLSATLAELATACQPPIEPAHTEDLLLELVGEILRLMRLRHQALLGLAGHKRRTITDLLPRLLQARQFVEARYLQPLKVAEVADYVALSEFHFGRLFKAAFDMTLYQYLIRLRLAEARRLLAQPKTNVTETALHVGYGSLSAFIHAFTRQFGLSPGRYRAQMQNEQDLASDQARDSL
jgi:AraC-like DNA-binding protein